VQFKTATQTVFDTMEELSKSEGQSIIVVFTNDSGEVVVKSNVGRVEAVGLLEVAKEMTLNRYCQEGGDT